MKYGVYAVYDKMAGYKPLFNKENDNLAIREFHNAVTSDALNELNANPEDFNLQKLGYYDTETGVIEPCSIQILCDAGQFIRKEVEVCKPKKKK